jgi:hypothetical protein
MANNVLGVRVQPEAQALLRDEAERNYRSIGMELTLLIKEAVAARREREKALAAAAPQFVTGLPTSRRKVR